jgi:uncharacterized membrane protein (UPF0127 family)
MAAFNRTRMTYLARDVRMARTHWTRMRGLIGATHADFHAGQALWIVPCRGVHTFAMRFPLDLIYMDRSGKVIELQEDVQPWRFAPLRMDAESVLELPPGTIRSTQTSIEDKVEMVTLNQPGELAA